MEAWILASGSYQHFSDTNRLTTTALTKLPVAVHREKRPTSETLPFSQTASNISDISKGCDCYQTTKFSSERPEAQSQITENYECPELTYQSDQELVKYENGTNGSDGK